MQPHTSNKYQLVKTCKLLLVWVVFALPYWSIAQTTNHPVIAYQGKDFTAAINQFQAVIDAPIQYNQEILPVNKSISFRYQHINPTKAFKDFLNQHGLDYEWFGGSLIIKTYGPPPSIKRYTISGRVTDSLTEERLVKAYVTNKITGDFTFTDEFGVFRLPASEDQIILEVYYDGFYTAIDTLEGGRDYALNIPMKFSSEHRITATDIVQIATQSKTNAVSKGLSDQFNINQNQLSKMPTLLGEVDVMRALSMNPGVVGGSEGMLGMYVRGGSPDQNLVMLDEVPIYNAYHLYGIFGAFNGDIVKSAQLYRGNIPTEYGGRLSSAVNIQSIDGDPNRWNGSINAGVLSNKINLQGPIYKNKTTLVVSARRSNLAFIAHPIAQALTKDSNNINGYNFNDINLKLIHRFSTKSVLTVSGFQGFDKASLVERQYAVLDDADYYQKNEQSTSWGNRFAAIRWQLTPNPRTRITLKSHITEYKFTQFNEFQQRKWYDADSIADINRYTSYSLTNTLIEKSASFKVEKQIRKYLKIQLGSEGILHTFNPGTRQIITQIDSINRNLIYKEKPVITPEINAHLHLAWQSAKFGFFDLGIRGTYFGLSEGQFYILPEPRLNYRYRFTGNNWFKLTACSNIQFFHQLNNLTMGLPSDLWVPSTAKFKPSSANQLSVGFTHTATNWQFSFETFQKKFNNLLEYKDNAVYVTSILNWEQTVTQGSGTAKGLEFLIEKTKGKFTGWTTYTLMYNNRNFTELNNGKSYPARYDRRHNLYLVGMYQLSPRIQISANWIFNSGFAYTLPIGAYPSPTPDNPFQEIFIYGDKNNARSKANHRLDVNAQFTWHKKRSTHLLNVGVYNCYNRQNPFIIKLGYNQNGEKAFYQMSILPLLPQVSYQYKF